MKHDEQIRLLRQLMHQLDTGTNLDAGVVLRSPASVFTSPALAAREKEVFFEGHPQMVGMSGDLPEPGSFFTLDEWGTNILATRDADGRFRAFLNACRHRGARVERESRGRRRRFSCPFHAWTYGSDGALLSVAKPDQFGEVDRACHGLLELPSAEAHGVLVVHPRREGTIDTDRLLEGLAPDFDGFGFGRYVLAATDTYEVRLNWKLAIDTFGETYHFPTLHRDTLAPFFHGNVQCFDPFERNQRMILCQRAIDQMRHRPENEWSIREGAFPVYWLFPNVIFNVGLNSLTVVRVRPHPEEVGRSISHLSFYVDPEDAELRLANADPDSLPEGSATVFEAFASVVRDEDYAAAADAQRSAESGIQEWFLFGRNEPTIHHYHNTYRKVLGMPPLDEA